MADQALFLFREYVQLCLTEGNAKNINLPMIQYNTKIYKGVSNTIDFIVRNNDRTPVNLVGYQIEAVIQRVSQPEVLIEKSVVALDETAGKATLILTYGEIEDWLAGFYRYAIRLTDVNGRTRYLYTDVNRSTYGDFELIEGMSSGLIPAMQILAKDFTPYPHGQYYQNVWSTGALIGDSQENQSNGMHTIVAYTTNFTGEFWIQASLSTNAPQEMDWFDVPMTNTSYPLIRNVYPVDTPYHFYYRIDWNPSIQVYNFTGNYYWARALFKNDPLNKGTFDKILYKK